MQDECNEENNSLYRFRPAFGCAQHPKAGRNTQQVAVCLYALGALLCQLMAN